MTRVRGPKLFWAPLLQPDSWSTSSPDCTQCTKSFQPNLRQCLPGKPPAGAEGLTSDQKWASPKWAAESNTSSQAVSSSLPRKPITSPTFNSLDGVWFLDVSLRWEEFKGNKCIGKDPPCHLHLGNALWNGEEEDPSPCKLLGEWCSLQQLPALPRFIPILSTQIQTCPSPPTSPCALSQRDELTSSISEFLKRSPTHSLNFTKPCQRPWSKIQK